jgi:hypothetical protein
MAAAAEVIRKPRRVGDNNRLVDQDGVDDENGAGVVMMVLLALARQAIAGLREPR